MLRAAGNMAGSGEKQKSPNKKVPGSPTNMTLKKTGKLLFHDFETMNLALLHFGYCTTKCWLAVAFPGGALRNQPFGGSRGASAAAADAPSASAPLGFGDRPLESTQKISRQRLVENLAKNKI